jgi:hypothetical protein
VVVVVVVFFVFSFWEKMIFRIASEIEKIVVRESKFTTNVLIGKPTSKFAVSACQHLFHGHASVSKS